MDQFLAIVRNTYLQAVRQPVFGIVIVVTLAGMAFAPFVTGFTLDDDNKMLRDIGLSTLLIQGLFLACFAAANVLDSEIEDRTVLTVAAKPVGRWRFVLGKYLGVLGALATAHYLSGLAFYMALRHGVLQTSAETSDITVIVFGPGVMALVFLAAGAMNYFYERRFLPSVIALAIPCLTLSSVILLVVDRNFELQAYETTQDVPSLPRELVASDAFEDIVEFRPDEGNSRFEGHSGKLVRSSWKGPINDNDRKFLLNLVDDIEWQKLVNFLVANTRKHDGIEILKAAILTFGAIAMLSAIAIAASTRLSILPIFLINLLVVSAGLASDQIVRPLAETGETWATVAYRLIPNFQCFWMVDALNESRSIPLGYIAHAGGYAALYTLAALLLAMALFETREVG